MSNTVAATKQIIMSDMFTDNEKVGERYFKVIDGLNGLSEGYLSARGCGYVVDFIHDSGTTIVQPNVFADLPADGKVFYRFTTSPDVDMATILQADVLDTDSSALVLSVYTGATSTDGAPVPAIPQRTDAPPALSVIQQANSVDLTNAFMTARKPVFSAISGNTGGGDGSSGFIRVLAQPTTFILELHNRANGAHYAQLQVRWSEIPKDYLPILGV